MVELIQIALSLLNLLLLLKPPNLGASPVEQALSSQPPGRQHQHLVATIAQYIFHRHNHRLPNLSVLLLKRLAMVSLLEFYIPSLYQTYVTCNNLNSDLWTHNICLLIKMYFPTLRFHQCQSLLVLAMKLSQLEICFWQDYKQFLRYSGISFFLHNSTFWQIAALICCNKITLIKLPMY